MSMDAVFWWVVSSSAAATVLAFVVLGLQRWAGQHLGSTWRHALWLIVLARLLTPIAPASRLSILSLLPRAGSPWVRLSPAPSRLSVYTAAAATSAVAPPTSVPRPQTDQPSIDGIRTATTLLVCLWLGGMGVAAAAMGAAHITIWRNARSRAIRIRQARELRILGLAKAELGIRGSVGLLQSGAVAAPSLFGIRKPCILLPSSLPIKLSGADLRRVFLHELGHCKRRDHLWNLLGCVACAVHWFNPAVWFVVRNMRAEAETACDDIALRGASPEQRLAYGRLLLRLAEALSTARTPVAAGSAITGSPARLRARLVRIARPVLARPAAAAGAMLLFALLAVPLFTRADDVMGRDEMTAAIRGELDAARSSVGALQELVGLADRARHNYPALARAAYVISHVGYHTMQTLEVARVAAAADREIDELAELVDLCVMRLGGQEVSELARMVVHGTLDQPTLRERIRALRNGASLKSLGEAVQLSDWLWTLWPEGREPEERRGEGLAADLSSVLTRATHNRSAIIKGLAIVFAVEQNADQTANVARLAAWAGREIPAMEDLVELSALVLRGSEPLELARAAARGELEDAELAVRVQKLRRQADIKTLREAVGRRS